MEAYYSVFELTVVGQKKMKTQRINKNTDKRLIGYNIKVYCTENLVYKVVLTYINDFVEWLSVQRTISYLIN